MNRISSVSQPLVVANRWKNGPTIARKNERKVPSWWQMNNFPLGSKEEKQQRAFFKNLNFLWMWDPNFLTNLGRRLKRAVTWLYAYYKANKKTHHFFNRRRSRKTKQKFLKIDKIERYPIHTNIYWPLTSRTVKSEIGSILDELRHKRIADHSFPIPSNQSNSCHKTNGLLFNDTSSTTSLIYIRDSKFRSCLVTAFVTLTCINSCSDTSSIFEFKNPTCDPEFVNYNHNHVSFCKTVDVILVKFRLRIFLGLKDFDCILIIMKRFSPSGEMK